MVSFLSVNKAPPPPAHAELTWQCDDAYVAATATTAIIGLCCVLGIIGTVLRATRGRRVRVEVEVVCETCGHAHRTVSYEERGDARGGKLGRHKEKVSTDHESDGHRHRWTLRRTTRRTTTRGSTATDGGGKKVGDGGDGGAASNSKVVRFSAHTHDEDDEEGGGGDDRRSLLEEDLEQALIEEEETDAAFALPGDRMARARLTRLDDPPAEVLECSAFVLCVSHDEGRHLTALAVVGSEEDNASGGGSGEGGDGGRRKSFRRRGSLAGGPDGGGGGVGSTAALPWGPRTLVKFEEPVGSGNYEHYVNATREGADRLWLLLALLALSSLVTLAASVGESCAGDWGSGYAMAAAAVSLLACLLLLLIFFGGLLDCKEDDRRARRQQKQEQGRADSTDHQRQHGGGGGSDGGGAKKARGAAALGHVLCRVPRLQIAINGYLLLTLFFFVWWLIAACVMTFRGPFVWTSNGYFGAWGALLLGGLMLARQLLQDPTVGRLLMRRLDSDGDGQLDASDFLAASNLGRTALGVLLCCGAVLALASLPFIDSQSSSEAELALLCGLTTVFIASLLLCCASLPPLLDKLATACLVVGWGAVTAVTTFSRPFIVGGNGFFACWLGLLCALLYALLNDRDGDGDVDLDDVLGCCVSDRDGDGDIDFDDLIGCCLRRNNHRRGPGRTAQVTPRKYAVSGEDAVAVVHPPPPMLATPMARDGTGAAEAAGGGFDDPHGRSHGSDGDAEGGGGAGGGEGAVATRNMGDETTIEQLLLLALILVAALLLAAVLHWVLLPGIDQGLLPWLSAGSSDVDDEAASGDKLDDEATVEDDEASGDVNATAVGSLEFAVVGLGSFGVGAISILLGLLLLCLSCCGRRVLRAPLCACGRGGGVVTCHLCLTCSHLLLWSVGVSMITFYAPFVSVSNGYFAAWFGFLLAGATLVVVLSKDRGAGGKAFRRLFDRDDDGDVDADDLFADGNLNTTLLVAMLLCALVLGASCAFYLHHKEAELGLGGSVATLFLVLPPLLLPLTDRLTAFLGVLLLLLWLVLAAVTTFVQPFVLATGNGYFSAWLGLMVAALYVIRLFQQLCRSPVRVPVNTDAPMASALLKRGQTLGTIDAAMLSRTTTLDDSEGGAHVLLHSICAFDVPIADVDESGAGGGGLALSDPLVRFTLVVEGEVSPPWVVTSYTLNELHPVWEGDELRLPLPVSCSRPPTIKLECIDKDFGNAVCRASSELTPR